MSALHRCSLVRADILASGSAPPGQAERCAHRTSTCCVRIPVRIDAHHASCHYSRRAAQPAGMHRHGTSLPHYRHHLCSQASACVRLACGHYLGNLCAFKPESSENILMPARRVAPAGNADSPERESVFQSERHVHMHARYALKPGVRLFACIVGIYLIQPRLNMHWPGVSSFGRVCRSSAIFSREQLNLRTAP
jgi:hypothetical protein